MIKDDNSLSEDAFTKVRNMIVNRQLSGGDVLIESRLANILGSTRTPLREALVRLEGAGILVKKKGRSFAVREVGAAEFFQSLRVRQYLESKAASLAVGKASITDIKTFQNRIKDLLKEDIRGPAHWNLDDDLHEWLAEVGGNKVLADSVRRLRITTQLFEVGSPFDRAEADAREHLAILQALEEGNARDAEAATLKHLKNIEKDVLEIVTGS
ncbi:MAG: GntR family transcriptional regulator [Rhodospirillales bacterium]|nr:GntR family transcriptional regulator [Rhodospirillales bacterium]